MLRNQTAYVEARQGGLTNRLDYRAIKIITGRICISQIHVSWKSGGPAISYHIGAHCRIGLTYRFSYRLFQRKFRVADGWIYDVNDMAACCQVYNYRLRMRSIFLYTDIYIYIYAYTYTPFRAMKSMSKLFSWLEIVTQFLTRWHLDPSSTSLISSM